MSEDINKIIERCKIVTLAHQPFFGAGASKLSWEADDTIPTACTDGTYIKFNPDFIRPLAKEQMVGLAVHEVMHVYSKHHLRRGDREPKLWNIAADYFINLLIQDAIDAEMQRRGVSCMSLPDGALLDDKWRGMSTEQIYAKLIENLPPHGGAVEGDFPMQSQWGEVKDAPLTSQGEIDEAERSVEIMVEQAHNHAKNRGKHFGSAEELINKYKKPQVDWRSVLRQMMQSLSIVDYTYQRPHKNYHHILEEFGSFIPDYHRENVGEIVVGIDTSGSCSDKEVEQFLGEIQNICEEVQPSKVHVVQCDSTVQHVDVFEIGDTFSLNKIHGRGGTSFQPVFDWVENEGINPVALVYFTDGFASAPVQPDYPVYWGVTSEHHGHLFGEVLPIQFN